MAFFAELGQNWDRTGTELGQNWDRIGTELGQNWKEYRDLRFLGDDGWTSTELLSISRRFDLCIS